MKQVRFAAATLAAILCAEAWAQAVIYVPQSLAEAVQSGQATVASTELDIGSASVVFDGNVKSLARSKSINPASVQIVFDEPVTVEYFRVYLSVDEHKWAVTAADNKRDLTTRSGSFRQLLQSTTNRSGRRGVKLDKPATARAFRLDVERTTGDDYVHFFEWQFCHAAQAKKLHLQHVVERAVAHKGAELEELPERITKPVRSVLVFRAQVEAADGTTIDVTDDIDWESDGQGLTPFGRSPGQFVVQEPGDHRLKANYGDLSGTVTIVGEPRTIENRHDDIEIWYIERLPRIAYDGPNGGWPAPGAQVTWRGHVYNWGKQPVKAHYEWWLDGGRVSDGEVVIPVAPPGHEATPIDLPWSWNQERHELTLRITPVDPLEELIVTDNELSIQTDALAVGFWVEESVWAHHHEHQHELPTKDANSFAGWAQRSMREWNGMFTAAVFPETPDGILDRVRLDRLIIVPDNALPLAGGLPTNNPDNRDRTVDMLWGFPATALTSSWWDPQRAIDQIKKGKTAPLHLDHALFHELGHARYLVDGYGFDVHARTGDDKSKPNVRVTDEHGSILGRYMPTKSIVHWRKHGGQMGGDYTRYGMYEALMLNRIAGKRARKGNYNAPGVIGEYLQEIPSRLTYEFVSAQGKPLANADVWIYQATPQRPSWYGKTFEDKPAIKEQTDARGRVTLDRTMFAPDGRIIHTWGHSNGVVLVRITFKGQHYYLFEEVTDANIAYNLGERDHAVFRRTIKLRTGDPSPDDWDAGSPR